MKEASNFKNYIKILPERSLRELCNGVTPIELNSEITTFHIWQRYKHEIMDIYREELYNHVSVLGACQIVAQQILKEKDDDNNCRQ